MTRTVAIVQARMGSTRLPGKVLRDLCGAPMLDRVLARTARAERVDMVLVATSTAPADDVLAEHCAANVWPCFRGDESDVLDRYYQAARSVPGAEVIVRITSDCPLIDPGVLDDVLARREAARADYASNTIDPRMYPRGLDAEAFTFAALERAWNEDRDPRTREHVTPYLYRHPEAFSILHVGAEADASRWRWTVDTPGDLELARAIYAHFGRDDFTWTQALAACEAHPEWSALNADVVQKAVP